MSIPLESGFDDPTPGWRPMETGEIIQEGDQMHSAICKDWVDCVDSIGDTPINWNPAPFRTRRPTPEPQSAVEWVNKRAVLVAVGPAYKVPRLEFLTIADALELAHRCAEAEAERAHLANDFSNMHDEVLRLSAQLAAAQAEAARLREALIWCLAEMEQSSVNSEPIHEDRVEFQMARAALAKEVEP